MTSSLVLPMSAMVLLTFVVLTMMFRSRVAAVKRGEVDARFYKTYQGENTEPRGTAQLSRHFVNHFEAPVLFYVACVTAMVVGQGSPLMAGLAWAFVATRVVHTIIHTGGNRIPPRIGAYFAGWIVLLVMWAVLALGATTAHAQEEDEEEVEPPATIEELREAIVGVLEEHEVPSIGITIVDETGPIYTDAIGKQNLEEDIDATIETMYRIGSTSKMYVALAVLKLVEEGRLSLDSKLADLAPEIEFENEWEETDPIRIAHLLEHTTGWDDIHLPEYAHNDPTPATLKEGLDYHPHSRTSRWKPGTRSSYCNSGPPVAAYVVEKITGQNFETYIQQTFFDPLGMTTKTYLQTEAVHEHGVVSYNNGNEPQDYWHISMRPSGSINASPADMAKMVEFFLDRGRIDGVPVVSEASLERMERFETTNIAGNGQEIGYGMHNYVKVHEQWPFRSHNGGVNGGLTEMAYQPELGLGYAFMINSGDGNAFREISELIGAYLTHGIAPPPERESIPVTAKHHEIAGFYEPINPRQEMARFIDRVFGVQRFWFDNNTLKRNGILGGEVREYQPVSDTLYKHMKLKRISLSSAVDPLEGPVLHVGDAVYKPISLLLAWGQIGIAALWGITIALSLVYLLIWGVRRLMKKLEPGPTIRIRVMPLLAGVSVITFVILFEMAIPNPFTTLGVPSFYSVGIMIATIAFAVFAALGFRDVVRYRHRAMNRGNYWFCAVSSTLHVIVALYLAFYGIIGLMTWT